MIILKKDKKMKQIYWISRLVWCVSVLGGAALALPGCGTGGGPGVALEYPSSHPSNQVDTLHGVKVPDPYRWLENANSAKTKAWVDAQNKVTMGYLEGLPGRERIRKRLTELWNYEKFGTPRKIGGRYFFSKNDGLQNQSVLYVAESIEGEARVLIDPNKLSKDGTVALASWSVSNDGKKIAYAISRSGSDWREFKVRDVDTGKDLADHILWAKFTGADWSKDGKGFYYSRYDKPVEGKKLQAQNQFQKVYYHQVGTPQSEDRLVYERKDQAKWGFGGWETEDGNYLMIHVSKGTLRKNGIFYKDLKTEGAEVVELLKDFDAAYYFVGNDGPVFYFQTTHGAPRGKVIAIDTRDAGREKWRTVVGESKDTLRSVSMFGDKVYAQYLKDAQSVVRTFSTKGEWLGEVKLPGIGSVSGFGGKRDAKETFYSFTSFTTPYTIYRYDLEGKKSEVYKKPSVDFDPNDYVAKQVFYTSKDGTRVPMFITHKKGVKLDGENPTYLYGYGGFNISLTPRFSISRLVWMELGGVYAQPSLRGGGEYGKAWHDAGTKLNKQNVFDDFIHAAKYLTEKKYTNPRKIAIAGGSNGGLLVGACMTQKPEMFGVALPAVGVMDMLRYHKFTIGWAWASDYGSPDEAVHFKNLLKYSPLHNLKDGTKYPATMVTTADHDDRVVPAHSYKFIARLQAAHEGERPVLIRIETKAGHGAGKPTSKRIAEVTDKYVFTLYNLGVKLSD